MNKEVKELSITVRGLMVNLPIKIKADILPVETWEYKNYVQEMEFFAINLVKFADVSLSVRLIRELLKKLPGVFPSDIDSLLSELEKKAKEKKNEYNQDKPE